MVDTIFNLIKFLGRSLLSRVFWLGTLVYSFIRWLFGSFTLVFAIMRGYTIYRAFIKLLMIPLLLTVLFLMIEYFYKIRTYSFINDQSIYDYFSTVIQSSPILNDVIIILGHSGFLLGLSIMFYFLFIGIITKITLRILF